jgi:alkylated DNA repair dioxygenase AlkB
MVPATISPATLARVPVELAAGSWVDHVRGFIPADQAARLHAELQRELGWEQRAIVLFGREVLQPRLVAWAGTLPYRYSGQTLPPRPFTPRVAELGALVQQHAGVAFNHVLANRYRDGKDSMGFHADAEPELGPDPIVATLSFGAARALVIVPRQRRGRERHAFTLAGGDLFVMGGACQSAFRHGIPRQPRVTEERISLTFRRILRPPPPVVITV